LVRAFVQFAPFAARGVPSINGKAVIVFACHQQIDMKSGRTTGQPKKSESKRLSIVYRPIDELKLDPRNPRHHTPDQIRKLADSIRVFGFYMPVVTDANDGIIIEHGRVLAAKSAGLNAVPTIPLQDLNPAQVTALRIADNRLAELSTWNEQLLGEQLKELTTLELGFSIELTGFAMGEIDLRIRGLEGDDERVDDPADTQPLAGPAVTRLGDLWLLDQHRVLCGSAIDEVNYVTLMDGRGATMVFTDPPFNVPIDGHASGLGHVHHPDFVMATGEMTNEEFEQFLTTGLSLLARHSIDGSLHFIVMDWRHLGALLTAGERVYSEMKNLIVWSKTNAGMGSLYRSAHELIFLFKNGRAPHRNNIALGRHGRNRTNVWSYPGANSFGRGGEEGKLLALHPTIKPVALVADAILDCTARGDIVLDGFLGSGTTVIAAERTGRKCCGLELAPGYVDVVVRRWESFTGKAAIHAGSGQTFAQIAAERVSP
jgi:DNA modification methylase